MIDYNKRLVEVSVILNHLDKKDYNKIPKEIIDAIEKNKDTEYIWNYDETKELKGQNVNRDTIAILTYINMKYLLNEKQKEFIQRILNENQKKMEKIKIERYNPDDIFNKKKAQKSEETFVKNNKNTALVEYKENFFIKLKKFICKLLCINQ